MIGPFVPIIVGPSRKRTISCFMSVRLMLKRQPRSNALIVYPKPSARSEAALRPLMEHSFCQSAPTCLAGPEPCELAEKPNQAFTSSLPGLYSVLQGATLGGWLHVQHSLQAASLRRIQLRLRRPQSARPPCRHFRSILSDVSRQVRPGGYLTVI